MALEADGHAIRPGGGRGAMIALASTMLFSLWSASPGCADAAVTTGSARSADPQAIARHERLGRGLVGDKADIVLVGDSLAQLWPSETLAPRRVLNLGVGGDRTQNILWRLRQYRLRTVSPKTVIVIAGTNNLGDGNSACAIAAGVEQVAALLRRTWPDAGMTLLAIPPRGAGFRDFEDRRRTINGLLRSLAAKAHYGFVAREPELACGFAGGYCPNYRNDHLHLTAAGYRILAAALPSRPK